jgi:hypothetical protein
MSLPLGIILALLASRFDEVEIGILFIILIGMVAALVFHLMIRRRNTRIANLRFTTSRHVVHPTAKDFNAAWQKVVKRRKGQL